MSEILKVVIQMKDDEATIGVKRDDTDPVFFMVKGDMKTILEAVAVDVEESKTRWLTAKQYPKAAAPPPSETKTPVPAPSRSPAAPAKPAAPKLQPSFDL